MKILDTNRTQDVYTSKYGCVYVNGRLNTEDDM
jgi:hypothetical protein